MADNKPDYYVPEQSKLPIFASLSLFLCVVGLANWLIELGEGKNGTSSNIFLLGLLMFVFVLWRWFEQVIEENKQGLNSEQLKRSYIWAMAWFIFSEFMFFTAFFGALFYVRTFSLDWLSTGPSSEMLWNNFEAQWPLMQTPDMALQGEQATVLGPEQNMANPGFQHWMSWLPFWNTVLLLSSSITVHMAHSALKRGKNGRLFNFWLALTVSLGLLFLVVQAEEYIHAYNDLGLTLSSGIYGATFFMLTGFHGAHVCLGTSMLLVQLMRNTGYWRWRLFAVAALFIAFYIAFNVNGFSLGYRLALVALAGLVLTVIAVVKTRQVFQKDDCFGFEASSWYWHFVDVVWLALFIFVYLLA
nr:cytochrome c oxidase subunit 3 [Agaribacterium haliotis]